MTQRLHLPRWGAALLVAALLPLGAGCSAGTGAVAGVAAGSAATGPGTTQSATAASGTALSTAAQATTVSAAPAATVRATHLSRRTSANLNLRRSPSLKAARILVIPKGTTLTVTATSAGFSRVSYKGHTGWASSRYLVAPPKKVSHPAIPRSATSYGVLVNKRRALSPRSYAPRDLVSVQGQKMRTTPAAALKRMMTASSKAGLRLGTTSGYRSYAAQKSLYARYQRSYGKAYAARYAAVPGTSEHQTGLAMDLKAVNRSGRTVAPFGSTAQATWVARNAWKYGFIVRYPAGASSVTGYSYEPWHVRYVGTKVSTTMHSKHIATLEAYYGTRG